MKKINYLLLPFLLLSLVGCQSEEEVFGNDTSEQTDVVISASLEDDAEARTVLGGDDHTKVLWSEDDQLSVFLGNVTNKKYILVNGAGETRADFESDSHTITGSLGTETKNWANVAYYPYNENITLAKKDNLYELNVTLPTTQNYAEESFGQNASPYVAVTQGKGDFEFMFKNVCALVGIKLIGNATITKVTLQSRKGNPIAGPAVVTTDGIEPAIVVDKEEGSSTILLDCGELGVSLDSENYKRFTFVIPPGTYDVEDLIFTVYDNAENYQSYEFNQEVVIARSGNISAKREYAATQKVVKVKLNGEGSYATIADAVNAITDKTTENVITLAAGSYTLPTSLNDLNLVIEGENADLLSEVILDMSAGGTPQYHAESVTFKNMTVKRKADAYGGLSHSKAEHFDNCIIEGTLVTYAPEVTVKNSKFVPAATEYYNVHIYSAGNTLFENCTFTTEACRAIYAHAESAKEMNIVIKNCQFISKTDANKDYRYHPAIRLHTELGIYGTLEISNCSVNGNFNPTHNGGLWVEWNNNTKAITYNFKKKVDGINPDGFDEVAEKEYNIFNANGLVYAANNLFAKGGTFNITDDIDMAGMEYPEVKITNVAGTILINGNEHTISSMTNQLIAYTGSATSVTVQDLTLDGTKFNIADTGTNGIAAFIGYAGTSKAITLDNCHLVNAELEGGHWLGGLVGYAAGYNVANNGPVFETLTIKDCSVKNSSIIGHDTSVGAIIGHATGDLATLVKIENAEVTGNTIVTDEKNKAGVILGTVGAAGPEAWNGEMGGTYINGYEESNNTVTANGAQNTKLYGRQGSKGGVLYIDGVQVIFEAAQLSARLTEDKANIAVVLANDIDLPITSLGSQTPGSGEYKLGGTSTGSIVIDLNGKKLNITTTNWSAIGANNPNATITIKNGTMTSTGNSAGTWNAWDVRFSNCNYVIENVTFEKEIALDNVGKKTTMKNVTINGTGDKYALWIAAEGQNVEIDGLKIISSGRGIKIDEQYVDSPEKVTLSVLNTTVNTAKKAAIVVKSAAGADIALSNVNIDAVEADKVNAVWVDADAAQHYGLVTVTGGTMVLEGTTLHTEGVLKNSDATEFFLVNATGLKWFANEVNEYGNNFMGKAVNLLVDIDLNDASWTRIGQYKATCFEGTFDGFGKTISNVSIQTAENEKDGNYATAFFGRTGTKTVIKNLTLDKVDVLGHHWTAALVGYHHGKVENCHVTNSTINCAHYSDDSCGDKAGAIVGICADNCGKLVNSSAADCTVKGVRDVGQLVGAGHSACVDSDCKATRVKVGVHDSFINCNDENKGMNIGANSLIGRIL